MFDVDMAGKVLRLLKALYGFKQYPRMWNIRIDKALAEFGLHRLTSDFRMYACFDGADRVLLGLFVDDMFMIGHVISRIGTVKTFIRDRVHDEKEMVLEKIFAGQIGADIITKNASLGVVRYNKKLLDTM